MCVRKVHKSSGRVFCKKGGPVFLMAEIRHYEKENLSELEKFLSWDNEGKIEEDDLLSLCFDTFSIVVICEKSVNRF